VRFHFLDSNWSASIFVKGRDDTRALDPQQLDRLDYFVADPKKWCQIEAAFYMELERDYFDRMYRCCSIILTSLDGQPISRSQRLLLVATARAAIGAGSARNDILSHRVHHGGCE
jgi:hypothetical protein